jgi:hypothetical protein
MGAPSFSPYRVSAAIARSLLRSLKRVSPFRPLALPAPKIPWPKHCLLDVTESMNTQLEITRRPHLIGFARGVRITLDGLDVANVGNGKTVTLEVTPGKHVVGAWLGSCPSPQPTIDFASGETVRLECQLKMGAFANGFQLTSNDGRIVTGAPVQAGHHGKLILILGLLGFIFGIFGLAALVQGIVDLNKMSRGQMDRSGELLTWVGTILGTIGFLVNLLLIIASFALGQR